MALFKSIPNDNVLATRVGEMLMVKSWLLILFLTGILGGFVAAISGFCGYHFRKALQTDQVKTSPANHDEKIGVYKSKA